MSSEPIRAKSLRVTRLNAEGQPMGEAQLVGVGELSISLDGSDEDWGAGPFFDYPAPEPFTTEVTLMEVDPDLLALFTGSAPRSTHAVEFHYRVPVPRRAWRVVWEWLRRTPRRYTEHSIYIPNAHVSEKPIGD